MSWWLSIAFDGVYAGAVAWWASPAFCPSCGFVAHAGRCLPSSWRASRRRPRWRRSPPWSMSASRLPCRACRCSLPTCRMARARFGWARPSRSDLAEVMNGVQLANQHFEVGDIDTWRQELDKLDALRTPATARYIDLWQRYAAEEAERRAGSRQSSRETLEAIRSTAGEMATGAFPALRPRLLGFLVVVESGGRPCPLPRCAPASSVGRRMYPGHRPVGVQRRPLATSPRIHRHSRACC